MCLHDTLHERHQALTITAVHAQRGACSADTSVLLSGHCRCAESGAQIVLSKLAIGDLGTQYFADRGIFCAGRVPDDDLQRVAKATGEHYTLCLSADMSQALCLNECLEQSVPSYVS